MTDEYEVIEFARSFEADDETEVVTANITAGGTRESSSEHNLALVRRPVPEEPATCGAEIASGGECQREVDNPEDKCWDHED